MPVRRGEERFDLDEPISIFAASGALSTGRIKDISLSGVAIIADESRALATKLGQPVNLFIGQVGFVSATVVRQVGQILALRFNLPPCVERDLLIRKLFTAGLTRQPSAPRRGHRLVRRF
jgi:cellulose synthase (UDP-forming)